MVRDGTGARHRASASISPRLGRREVDGLDGPRTPTTLMNSGTGTFVSPAYAVITSSHIGTGPWSISSNPIIQQFSNGRIDADPDLGARAMDYLIIGYQHRAEPVAGVSELPRR